MLDAVSPIMTTQPVPAPAGDESAEGDFDFDALIDVVNPLQHLPVVGALYRELTGDKIGTPASIAGGALYGGVFGFFGALGNEFLKAFTGRDVGETVLALLQGGGADFSDDTSIATSSDPYRATRAYEAAQSLTNPG
jgi:hypothetical protein